MIEIFIDHPVVHAGDFLSGRVQWKGDRRPNRFIVAALWETEGAGNVSWGVGRGAVIVPSDDAREATFPVRLMIPHEGPISFRGSLITINWKLRVRVDQPGPDEYAEAAFRVEPRKHKRAIPAS